MLTIDKAAILERVAQWERAAAALEELRRREIREANTENAIASFDGFYRNAAENNAPRLSSGLIEQQHWFQKLRAK